MVVRQLYLVRAFHKQHEVASDTLECKSLSDAYRLAVYVTATMVRQAVPPSEFDPSRVSFEVDALNA